MVDITHQVEAPTFAEISLNANDIQVRKISLSDLWLSLRQGYEDYSTKPSSIPFLIILYPLSAIVFTLFAFGEEMRYLAFPAVAGIALLGPIVAIAFFEMSRHRERGLPMRWRTAFGFIHTYSFAPILALTLIMMLLYLGWLYMAEQIYFGLFGDNQPTSMSDFVEQVFTTRRGGALIFYGNFVGFLFAFTAMALSVVAFPLTVDKPVTSITAIRVSIKAFTSNFYVLAVWGIVVVAILALGTVVFLIGLAIALPILGHATWHLYRKLIEP